jgi:hypothetical protein
VRAALAGLVLSALIAGACGGSSSSFPEEAECPAPAPLPTSRAQAGSVSPELYIRRIQGFAQNLERLRSTLRAAYPEDTFYRRDEFRPDFAEYASQTVCTAEAMLVLSAPDSRYAEYDSNLDVALTALIEHTRAGREAVRKRNVSDYRGWYRDADEKINAVMAAAANLP